MKKECEIIQDLLFGYNDNTLKDASKELVEKHLSNCNECQEILKEIQNDANKNQNEPEKIDYLKKINKKINKKNKLVKIGAIILAIIIVLNLAIILNCDKGEMVIFIEKDATQEQIAEIEQTIELDYDGEIKFKTKEECFEDTKSKLHDKSYLVNGWEEDNPFRDELIIEVDANLAEKIAPQLREMPGVAEIVTKVYKNPYTNFVFDILNKIKSI